jgi:hypothetical protein
MYEDGNIQLFRSLEESNKERVGWMHVLIDRPQLQPFEVEILHAVVELLNGVLVMRID